MLPAFVIMGNRYYLSVETPAGEQSLPIYPSVFGDAAGNYVRPVVRIEGGARSDRWPVAEQALLPYFAEAFPEAFPHAAFTVPGVDQTTNF